MGQRQTQRQPLSHPRPRSVATFATATRTSQRAATLAARPTFGSKAGKTLVLSPELAKYRELVRGMFSLEIPCVKCAGQFARMVGCKPCSGTGKQLPEPELLLWRWPHNHKAWGKVIAKVTTQATSIHHSLRPKGISDRLLVFADGKRLGSRATARGLDRIQENQVRPQAPRTTPQSREQL